jgi:hypothetical protein
MPSEVRLTRAQKWDLLRMSGAAVVSTVFFAVPMFLERPSLARIEPPPAGGAASIVPDVVAADKPALSLVASAPATVSVNTVSVVTSTEVAEVTTPVLQRAAAAPRRHVSVERIQARARADAPAAIPFGRRLARLIAGNGRYGVRPFPSVGTPGS